MAAKPANFRPDRKRKMTDQLDRHGYFSLTTKINNDKAQRQEIPSHIPTFHIPKQKTTDNFTCQATVLMDLDDLAVSKILGFLDIEDLLQIERCCSRLQRLSCIVWEGIDADIPSLGKSVACTPKLRALRWKRCMDFAARMETQASFHYLYDQHDVVHPRQGTIESDAMCAGCSLMPDLCYDVFEQRESSHEFFLRLSSRRSNSLTGEKTYGLDTNTATSSLIWQGFAKAELEEFGCLKFDLRDIRCGMENGIETIEDLLSRSYVPDISSFDEELVETAFGSLLVTVAGINQFGCAQPVLVVATGGYQRDSSNVDDSGELLNVALRPRNMVSHETTTDDGAWVIVEINVGAGDGASWQGCLRSLELNYVEGNYA